MQVSLAPTPVHPTIRTWYIPSEKIGQHFWPPRNGFFGINYHQWTSGNAFWPFLAPPDPWGLSGGSVEPKFSTFCGATFGFQNVKFWIVSTENTIFSRFLAKISPSRGQKWPFLGQMGYAKKWIFLNNTIFKLVKIAPKVPFWVNNNVRKWWAWSFIEIFSGCQNWDFWSCSHAHWEKRSYMPDVAMKGLKWP